MQVMWKTFTVLYGTANLFGTIYTKFYQNPPGFVEDMTKTFWCVFPVHTVGRYFVQCRFFEFRIGINDQTISHFDLSAAKHGPTGWVLLT